jgi:2-alkenal reductase
VSFVADSFAARWGVEGVIIQEVEPGSTADAAGLTGIEMTRSRRRVLLGDVIVMVNGKRVRGSEDLSDALEAAGLGSTVRLTVQSGREGKTREVQVRLRDVGHT